MSEVRIITGPPTSKVSKKEAAAKLVQHPEFPKGSSYSLEEVEGRWVAAFTVQAGPPPAFLDKGDDEGSDEPKEEKPEGDDAPDFGGDDDEGSDEPKVEEGAKHEKGEEKSIAHLTELVQKICDALGLSDHDSMIPGADAGPPAGGPQGPPPGGPGDEKQHIVHERALKPGEAAPGQVQMGAPSFASVNPNHPWASVVDVKRSFVVEEPIGDAPLKSVLAELQKLAQGTGYTVKQIRENTHNGQRTAKALISR